MKKIVPVIIFFLLIILVQIGYWVLVSYFFIPLEKRGQFGDSFGALTALFSGLAFGGLIFAILLQSRELALQRKDLSLTREEMAASRKEHAKSAEAQAKLVERQMITARINGLAAIVQGRYQYAAALGANSENRLKEVTAAETLLIEMLQEVGDKEIDLPKYKLKL